MKKSKFLENVSALHYNECCAPIVESLCAPLRDNFGITHFGCIRIFENGQFLRIANNLKWTQTYFESEFYNDSRMYDMKNVPLNESYYTTLLGNPFNRHSEVLYSKFNIWNFLFIYERVDSHCDFWFFATGQSNPEILNFYLNNKVILKHFTLYFKEKAADLFNIDDPSKLITTTISPLKERLDEYLNGENFIEDITYDKYYLSGKFEGKSLSKREAQCLSLFSQGKTMKDIGENINLSPRTVEAYINNIKIKLNCHTRSELITVLFQVKNFPF